MTRIAATLVIGLLVTGCGLLREPVPTPEPVQLLTSDPQQRGCYSLQIDVPLSVDPTYGTGSGQQIVRGDWVQVVAWRAGFTGRRIGSEVEVLDPQGNVVATTGHTYSLQGGYPPTPSNWPGFPYNIFWACGDVHPAGFRPDYGNTSPVAPSSPVLPR